MKFVVLAAVALLTACADKPGGPIPYNLSLGAPDAPTLAPLESGYKIAPMDTVSVKVFKSEDISGDYQVDLAGNISLPLVGEVPAANLTTAQLDERLTQVLGQKYFQHPDVSVGIKASTRRSVTVDGAVKQAGTFPLGGPTSLIRRSRSPVERPRTPTPTGSRSLGASADSARRPRSISGRSAMVRPRIPKSIQVTSSSSTARRSRKA